MGTFYLVRHGEKERIPGDPGLAKLGIGQAEKTGEYFVNHNISRIISSPLKRTIETAETIGRYLKLGIELNTSLREKMNWGDVKNQSFESFYKEWQYTKIDRYYKPEKGRSSFQTGNDCLRVIKREYVKVPPANIVLVTSGGVISDFLINVFPEKTLKRFVFDFMDKNDDYIKECSITTVLVDKENFILKGVAETKHL